MGLFQRKKKHPLFGGRIPPSCAYCQHNSGGEGQVACALRRQPEGEACKNTGMTPFCGSPGWRPPCAPPNTAQRIFSCNQKAFEVSLEGFPFQRFLRCTQGWSSRAFKALVGMPSWVNRSSCSVRMFSGSPAACRSRVSK